MSKLHQESLAPYERLDHANKLFLVFVKVKVYHNYLSCILLTGVCVTTTSHFC